MKTKKNKKIEFSKLMFILIFSVLVEVIVFSEILMWHTGDPTALEFLIPSVVTACATEIGFYKWKAKSENTIKLQNPSDDSQDDVKG